MKAKLLAAIVAFGGITLSSQAPAVLTCNNYATLGALQAAGSCIDNTDQDLLLTFTATTLPLTTLFTLVEVQGVGVDFYAVNLDFGNGINPAAPLTFSYSLASLTPLELLDAANFDTNVQGTGFLATKQISDSAGAPLLTLTSINGSRDPAQGETPFAAKLSINVVDTINPGTGVYFNMSNSYQVRAIPEPSTLALLGLGLLGVALRRRR